MPSGQLTSNWKTIAPSGITAPGWMAYDKIWVTGAGVQGFDQFTGKRTGFMKSISRTGQLSRSPPPGK